MRWLILICVACLALMVSGCGAQQDETVATTPTTEAPPTATEAPPTSAPTPTDAPTQPPPSPTTLPVSVGAGAELIDQVQAAFAETLALSVTIAPTSGLGINGVIAFPLESPPGWPRYWAAYTIGLRNFDTDQPQVVAIYTQRADGAVEEVTRLALTGSADQDQLTSPDYLGEGSVTQAKIEPEHIWLTVEGGAGRGYQSRLVARGRRRRPQRCLPVVALRWADAGGRDECRQFSAGRRWAARHQQ